MRADLTQNAALFGKPTRQTRAPVEIAHDPQLARYRVNVVSRSADSCDGVETAQSLDRADLAGEASTNGQTRPMMPMGIEAGALTWAGNGVLMIDASDLMAQYNAWPLLKAALRSGLAMPALNAATSSRFSGPALPVECRVVVVGELEDYLSWCRLDRDVPRQVSLIRAFKATAPRSADSERRFARHVSAIVAELRTLPLDGAAIAALLADQTRDGMILTDLDAARDTVIAAAAGAKANGRKAILAEDIQAAAADRKEALALLHGVVPQ